MIKVVNTRQYLRSRRKLRFLVAVLVVAGMLVYLALASPTIV